MMESLSKREKIIDIVRVGMERIPGYERQQGYATGVGNEIFDEFLSGQDVSHCCECVKREIAVDKHDGIANVAASILTESSLTVSATLRDVAEEYLLSFFRINSSLEVPKF